MDFGALLQVAEEDYQEITASGSVSDDDRGGLKRVVSDQLWRRRASF